MKILYIIHDFLPRHQAGAEIYTHLLARELSKKHEVLLFFTEITPHSTQYRITRRSVDTLQCIEVFRPPEASLSRAPYNDEKMEAVFREILITHKPDIIHIQHLLYHSLRYPAIALEMNIPSIYTLHDYWLTCPRWGQRIRKDLQICHSVDLQQCARCIQEDNTLKIPNLTSLFLFLKNILKKKPVSREGIEFLQQRNAHSRAMINDVRLFISPSPFLQRDLIQFGIPAEKIILSDCGVSLKQHVQRTKQRRNRLRFGFIGTISEHKGVHILVEAFNSISEERAELHLYGDLSWFPDYSRRLQKAARSPSILFKGAIPNDQVAATLATIDVLVVPSIWFENSPITIHEAFLAGVPVITSNLGGMADLVDDRVNGLLFEVNNGNSLSTAIQELIQSRELLEQLRRGIPTVKSVEENSTELTQIYKKIITE